MHDAHYHFSEEIVNVQKKNDILSLCNVANLEEWHIAEQKNLTYSCGVHPWTASFDQLEKMWPVLEQAPWIGEIGMDRVWCDNDLEVQKEVFEAQLKYAYETHKPVILHTKGQEKEILELLKKYPNTYIVHWYSSPYYLEEYDQIASYFTIGPSIGKDETVTNVAKKIPIEKLLIESDGIDAIEWAVGHRDYIKALKHSIKEIARIKKISPKKAEQILDENFKRIIEGD